MLGYMRHTHAATPSVDIDFIVANDQVIRIGTYVAYALDVAKEPYGPAWGCLIWIPGISTEALPR